MSHQLKFSKILSDEITAINSRRGANGRPHIEMEEESSLPGEDACLRPTPRSQVVGLALSGGGIRSAAFCLGVLQALGGRDLLKNIDYLSTVSGGGYIGSALTAAASAAAGNGRRHATNGDIERAKQSQFPFGREQQEQEAPGVRHIRDYSNYLFPSGIWSFLPNFVICLRGIAANILLILPFLLLFAVINITTNRTADKLGELNLWGWRPPLPPNLQPFGITQILLLVLAIFLSIWALCRSLQERRLAEIGGERFGQRGGGFPWLWTGVVLLGLVALFALLELQPLVLKGMFDSAKAEEIRAAARAAKKPDPQATASHLANLSDWLKLLGAILASLATIIGLLSGPLAAAAKRGTAQPGWLSFLSKGAATLAIYIAGLSIPFLLWLAHIYLSYWGICKASTGPCETYAPEWLKEITKSVFGGPDMLWAVYLCILVVTFAISWFLTPNANSLHRLYRDRLSKAFLFDPLHRTAANGRVRPVAEARQPVHDASSEKKRDAQGSGRESRDDLVWLDQLKLSHINCQATPYHLVNAALNIEGSKYANRRGRNADFFFFSPLFVGGEATGYAATQAMEKKVEDLDLATAMAVSGAAVAPNRGVNTIKPLTMTLAILNIRVGYWMPNPGAVAADRARFKIKKGFRGLLDQLYFFNELFGLLREDSDIIYLTDGGDLENLGIYELLRRRCRLIIAIDAEADPAMTFGSFMALQRMARIDLGTEIDLPWAPIREATWKAGTAVSESGGQLLVGNAAEGPHCAIGTIRYPANGTGILLYVKSSLTGDESDDIIDYKRRFAAFPQESTLDQLFSEEQFEVYRALGRHIMDRVLSGTDEISVRTDDAKGKEKAKWSSTSTEPLIAQACRMLCRNKHDAGEFAPSTG